MLPLLTAPLYRSGLRRTWGAFMAPVAASTRLWTAVVTLTGLLSLLLGYWLGRARKPK